MRAALTLWVPIAAAVAVAFGLRLDASGSGLSNAIITAAVLVTVTFSFRRWESVGSVGTWSAAIIAVAVALIDWSAGSSGAAVAAFLVGLACVAVLIWAGAQRVAARLGQAGATVVGFIIAALVVDAGSTFAFPRSMLVPALLAAIALLDGACAWLTRARRPDVIPRAAGLVGRIQVRRVSKQAATVVVLGSEALLAVTAIACARGVVTAFGAAVVGLVLVLVLLGFVVVLPAHSPRGSLSTRARFLVGAAVVVLGAVAAYAGILARHASQQATAARTATESAITAIRKGDLKGAEAAFGEAKTEFDATGRALSGAVPTLSLGLPVVGQNLQAARDLADVGSDLSRVGIKLATVANPHRLALKGGSIRLDELRRIQPRLADALVQLERARTKLGAIDAHPLVSPLARVLRSIDRRLNRAVTDAKDASGALRVLPAILGGNGDRHYFLAVQNNAEVRGTGGFMGNWGVITASDGHMDLSQFGRISELNDASGCFACLGPYLPADFAQRNPRFAPTWGDLNITPDFATLGPIVATAFPKSGGQPIDGVISVDPQGLAAILKLTGPITVPTWPVPITADNIVKVTLLDAYSIPDQTQRVAFLGDVARQVWSAFSSRPLGRIDNVAESLAAAVEGRHIMAWFSKPTEQQLARHSDLAGTVPPAADDQVTVVSNNDSSNKIDQFVARSIDYSARLEPLQGTEKISVKGRLQLRVKNSAPTSGLPSEVIGPTVQFIEAGGSRSYVSVLSPLSLDAVTAGGAPTSVARFKELDRNSYSLDVRVASGQVQTVVYKLSGTVRERANGWYDLHIARQPLLVADHVHVVLKPAPGYHFANADGLRLEASGRKAKASIVVNEDTVLRVRVVPD